MRIVAGEPILFSLQKDPLAFVVQNADGQQMTFCLPVKTAREIALAFLNIPEVGQGFEQIAEAEVIRRLQLRQLAAIN
jgi:hypothetical protein